MDVLTHLFLPYAAALFAFGVHKTSPPVESGSVPARWPRLRVDPRPAAGVALVVGVAGMAPDIDGLYSAVKTLPGMWWLQHRGFSHTLIGAPLHALLLVGLLHLLARKWPDRFGALRFRPAFVPLAIIGSWVHLVLDGITYAGTPAWFPFADGRVTYPLFHWLVIWLFPFWALFLIIKLLRNWGPQATVRAGAVALAVLVVLAGVRLVTMPEVAENEILLPRSSSFEWTVLRPHDNGTWEAFLVRGDTETGHRWYESTGPRDEPALAAIAKARDTDAYRGYRMGLFGPEVVNVTRTGDATWVNFTSVAQRFEVESGLRWTPAEPMALWGIVSLRFHGDAVDVVQAGW